MYTIFNFIQENLTLEYYKYNLIQVEEILKDGLTAHLATFVLEDDNNTFTYYGKDMSVLGELDMYKMLTVLNNILDKKDIYKLKTESTFPKGCAPRKYLTLLMMDKEV